MYPGRMLQLADLHTGLDIPQPCRPVPRGAHNASAVRTECRTPNRILMSPERLARRRVGFQIPEPDRPVVRRRDEPNSVRTESGMRQVTFMSLQWLANL